MSSKRSTVVWGIRGIDEAEIGRLLGACSNEMKIVVVFIVCAKLPLKALLNLEWRNIANHQIKVANRESGKSLVVEIAPPLRACLAGMIRGDPGDFVFPRYVGTLGYIDAHIDFLDALHKATLQGLGRSLSTFNWTFGGCAGSVNQSCK
jgi:hypothetical protein